MTDHLPDRPGWTCQCCREEWPCLGARTDLLIEYADTRSALGMYLTAQMMDTAIDLDRPVDDEFHARFLGWVHQHHTERPQWLNRGPLVFSRRQLVENAENILTAHVRRKSDGRCACGADRCPKRTEAIRFLYSRYASLPERRTPVLPIEDRDRPNRRDRSN